MSEHDEQSVDAPEDSAQPEPPARPTTRQMTEAELASEDARGRLVALVSIGIVACLSASFFFLWLVQKDAEGGSNLADRLLLLDDHAGSFIAAQFFLAVGILLTGAILLHLALAVSQRVPTTPKALMAICIAGPALIAIVLPASTLLEIGIARDFAEGTNQTLKQAEELRSGTAYSIAQFGYLVGALLYAVAWMMVGIFSVRTGLLTRLVGYTAVAIGLANVIAPPLAGIVTVFWVGAVTIMLLSRGGQKPPAWILGRPVPWTEVAAKGEEIRSEADAAEVEVDEAEFEDPVPEDDR